MRKKRAIIVGFLLVLMSVQAVWGAESDSEEKVYAVQNRIFHRNHEIDLNLGYVTDDAFYKIYPFSLGYTFNFSENWGWEVGRFQYLVTEDRKLQNDLKDDFNAQTEFFIKPKYMVHSHLIWRPLYGKSAVLNRMVVNHETYFLVGLGMTQYETTYSTGEKETEDAVSISFGAGFKYFLNQKFCLNVEVRNIYNQREDENENNVYFGLGLGWRFNLAPRKIEEDPTIKKLDEILGEE